MKCFSLVALTNPEVLSDFGKFRKDPRSHGLEYYVICISLFLRILSLGAWIKRHDTPKYLEQTPEGQSDDKDIKDRKEREIQDKLTEQYLLLRLFYMAGLFATSPTVAFCFGIYCLVEVLITAMSTLLLVKRRDLHKDPTSIGRSLILQSMTLAESTVAFAAIYRVLSSDLSREGALYASAMVLATISQPTLESHQWVVSTQVAFNLLMITVLIGGFVSLWSAYRTRPIRKTRVVNRPRTKSIASQEAQSISCPCCLAGISKSKPRICPICKHQFRGNGWGGIDAHWRARHEEQMSYEQFWNSLCKDHRA